MSAIEGLDLAAFRTASSLKCNAQFGAASRASILVIARSASDEAIQFLCSD
jgi:hypothetical protein